MAPNFKLANSTVQNQYDNNRFNFVHRPFDLTYRKERAENQIQEYFDKFNKEKYQLHNKNTGLRQNHPTFQIIISKPLYSCKNITSNQLHHYK